MLESRLQFLIVIVACALNERMQNALDYKAEEVRVLKQTIRTVAGKSRIDFTQEQRSRLALLGKELTPKQREELRTIDASETHD